MAAKKRAGKKAAAKKAAAKKAAPKGPGRPRKIGSPAEFDQKVDDYVGRCLEESAPITWTGMALALGFTSREAIDEYEKYEGFFDSVKRAKLFVEHGYEMRLHGNNPTGAIFALKNMRWTDKQEVEHKGRVQLIIESA